MLAFPLLLFPIFLLSASAVPFLDTPAAAAPATLPDPLLVSEKHLVATALRARDVAQLTGEDQIRAEAGEGEGIGGTGTREDEQDQEQKEIWTIRDMKRTCFDTDNLCEWDFVIDIGPLAPGEPGPVARYTSSSSKSVMALISDVSVFAHARAVDDTTNNNNDNDQDGSRSDSVNTAATTVPLQTTCKHLTFSSPDQGIPASRATTTTITKCGVFSVTSGWTRVEQPGERRAASVVPRRSPPGDVLAAAAAAAAGTGDCDTEGPVTGGGAGWEEITDGFTVLSVVDFAKGVLVWPAYSDQELLGGGEIWDRSYVVQDIP